VGDELGGLVVLDMVSLMEEGVAVVTGVVEKVPKSFYG
jgi:hypothetical protein